ncbi:MAG: YeeE/YedE family protein [Cocleimonas sp.]|nr:YeeE/YedE family protein [Cocleimonas sp.]
MENYILAAWLGGVLMGIFVVMHFVIIGRGVGGSTGFVCAVKRSSKSKSLFFGYDLDPLKFFFSLGLPLGGLIHLLFIQDGTFAFSFDMGIYDSVLPSSDLLKGLMLVAGGALLGIGARMAGGCTSGHALAGGALLNPVSLAVAGLFFATAIGVAQLLFYVF